VRPFRPAAVKNVGTPWERFSTTPGRAMAIGRIRSVAASSRGVLTIG